MSGKKCIYKAKADENDEDGDSLMSPCFQISNDVQLKDVPTTGEEYLLKVMTERKNYSVVSKCDRDFSKFAKNQSCFVKEIPRPYVADKLKPTVEWQNIQVADFSEVRLYVSRMVSKRDQWPSSVTKINVEQNNVIGWRHFFEKREPTLSCVLGISYTILDKGLEALTDIIDKVKPGDTIEHTTGQWIYAFLACIRQPLQSDTVSTIRDLARKCAEIRSHLDENDENVEVAVAPLNLFICLVAKYFQQFDLAD